MFIYLFGKINVLAEFISHNPSACLKLMKRLITSFNHSVSIFLIFPFLGIKKVSSFTFLLIRGDHRVYFCCYFFHAANSVVSKHGRGGGTRTPSRRFWRTGVTPQDSNLYFHSLTNSFIAFSCIVGKT